MLSHSGAASITAMVMGREEDADADNRNSGDDGRAPVFSQEECQNPRPVHPDSMKLFQAWDGKLGFIRYIPLFGPAIEAYGYKFIIALDVTELLSKGIANYTLQNSYFPMFTNRFGADAMMYQRYQNVAMMGWSIKPLMALQSDAVALFGYSKRWYMAASAVSGAVGCFLYALLPATPSSGPVAAVILFTVGFCQANLDILSEGFYSRLMRKVPLAGPALVSTVWWMLSIGNIVASFIEGPLSDSGKEAIGAYIACACMVVTIPFFVLNLYGERTNREERMADYTILREEALARRQADREAAAAAVDGGSGSSMEQSGDMDDADVDLTAASLSLAALEARAAAKNSELQSAGIAAATGATGGVDGVGNSRELPSGLNAMGDYSQDLVGFSMDLALPLVGGGQYGEENVGGAGRNGTAANTLGKQVMTVSALTDDLPEEDVLHDEDMDMLVPRIRTFCRGAVEFNAEVVIRNKRITIYAVIMTVGVIALAIVTILSSSLPLLFTCTGVSLLVSLVSFWALPWVVAKASLFAFLNQMLYVQITGPLNSFYLATPECLPDGPHFSYFFYNSISAVIGSVANMAGVTLFTYVFSKRSYRLTFVITIMAEIIGSIFDLIMVKRWNVAMHIPDHVMYVWGDAVVYQVAYMLAWMPMVVLLSQLCPRGSEAIVYALLAGFSNMGSTMATEIGSLLMEFVWPVKTTPGSECDFHNLPILVIVSHLCVPLLQIPLVFLLIPAARVCDELDGEGNVVGVKSHSAQTCHNEHSSENNDNDALDIRSGNEDGEAALTSDVQSMFSNMSASRRAQPLRTGADGVELQPASFNVSLSSARQSITVFASTSTGSVSRLGRGGSTSKFQQSQHRYERLAVSHVPPAVVVATEILAKPNTTTTKPTAQAEAAREAAYDPLTERAPLASALTSLTHPTAEAADVHKADKKNSSSNNSSKRNAHDEPPPQ